MNISYHVSHHWSTDICHNFVSHPFARWSTNDLSWLCRVSLLELPGQQLRSLNGQTFWLVRGHKVAAMEIQICRIAPPSQKTTCCRRQPCWSAWLHGYNGATRSPIWCCWSMVHIRLWPCHLPNTGCWWGVGTARKMLTGTQQGFMIYTYRIDMYRHV